MEYIFIFPKGIDNMLNYIWGGMILIGIVVAAFNGRIPDITNAAIDSSKEAVTTCVTMLGILSMWTGLMQIAEKAGIIKELSKKMLPLLKFLFPEIPVKNKALQYISTNVIANLLGLGWAATPAGIKAMQEMQKFNTNKEIASRSMCMFMVFNMSSLQLISVNLIAYRAQYNSVNPSEIIGPGIFATLVSTVIGILVIKIIERWTYK